MTLPANQLLGDFELLGQLGSGAMGEVYRARDTSLGRDVAIKVLPEEFVRDDDLLARFEREARVLASLNHPNIASIFEIGTDGTRRFLVLELVTGETLEERLQRGALTVAEATTLFLQVAVALECAHDHGVIHRDFKPANVMVTRDGQVKLLDFGLAKTVQQQAIAFGHDETVIRHDNDTAMTGEGRVIGTPAYMSPEQASGQAVDKRADIWAFGCCLYEALAGSRPFDGETATKVIAGILERDPDWATLPHTLPSRVRLLLWRCLQKDPQRRLRDIGEARFELAEAEEGSPAGFAVDRSHPRSSRQQIGWTLLGVGVGLLLGLTGLWATGALSSGGGSGRAESAVNPGVPHATPFHVSEVVGGHGRVSPNVHSAVAIAPDGEHVAVILSEGDKHTLRVRESRSTEWRDVAGAGRPESPAFSSDSKSLFFCDDRKRLRSYSLRDGTIQTVVPEANSTGVAFGKDILVLPTHYRTGLSVFDRVTLKHRDLTTLSQETLGHFWPHMLPDGKHVLYTDFVPELEKTTVRICAIDGSMDRILIPNAFTPKYSASGHVLFVRDGNVLAVRFDPVNSRISGSPIPLANDVFVNAIIAHGSFDASSNGILVFLRESEVEPTHQFFWVNRDGSESPLPLAPKNYGGFSLSPDDSQLALTIDDGNNQDLWLYRFESGLKTRLTSKTNSQMDPQWMNERDSLVYVNDAPPFSLVRFDVQQKRHVSILKGEFDSISPTVSADGHRVAFCQLTPARLGDLFFLEFGDNGEANPIKATPFDESLPAISPNGRHIAYQSNPSGENQVFIVEIADPSNTRQVSVNGGTEPMWSRDGAELFFRHTNRLWSVAVDPESGKATGQPTVVFQCDFAKRQQMRTYQPSRDASRFLVLKDAKPPVASRVHFLFNVNELLEPMGR